MPADPGPGDGPRDASAGGIALHYIHDSRTADIGRVERWVAARRIRASEARKADALAAQLRSEAPLR